MKQQVSCGGNTGETSYEARAPIIQKDYQIALLIILHHVLGAYITDSRFILHLIQSVLNKMLAFTVIKTEKPFSGLCHE